MADTTDSVRTSRNAIFATVVIGALLVIRRNAWMSDDAYITLRTVDHFVEGRGLTWNPGERVQAYTHPLWLLCLSSFYFVTGEEFTSIGLSHVVTLGALFSMLRYRAERPKICAALILALVSTRAFVDYSTSGLENPLTHGVTDEQAFWLPETGLLMASRGRDLPAGNEREAGEKAVTSDELSKDVRRVVHGPLFTSQRWGAIWRLHTREYKAMQAEQKERQR